MDETHHAGTTWQVCAMVSLLNPRIKLLKADQDALCEGSVADVAVRGRRWTDKQCLAATLDCRQHKHSQESDEMDE